jgi:NADH-quinone oxidoreductase subunit J
LTGLLAAAVARSQDAVQAATQTGTTAPTKALANLLFQDFVYPFELTSFLILVAILGAIVLAAPRSDR